MSQQDPTESSIRNEFSHSANEGSTGLISEFWTFLVQTRNWWLLPIVVVLLLVGLVAILGSSAAAPFIYTLF